MVSDGGYLATRFGQHGGHHKVLHTKADKLAWQIAYLLRVYSVEILLMMGSGHVRNMYIILSNKFEKQCISLAFVIRIHNIARSSECKTSRYIKKSANLQGAPEISCYRRECRLQYFCYTHTAHIIFWIPYLFKYSDQKTRCVFQVTSWQ